MPVRGVGHGLLAEVLHAASFCYSVTVTTQDGLSPELRTLLGNVVIEFAVLESTLALGIVELLEAPSHQGRIVTSYLTFMEKHGVYRALALDAAAGDEALVTEIEDLCKGLQKNGEDRNRYLHDLWISFRGSAVKVEWKKGGDFDTTLVNEGELSTFTELLRAGTRALLDQIKRFPPSS